MLFVVLVLMRKWEPAFRRYACCFGGKVVVAVAMLTTLCVNVYKSSPKASKISAIAEWLNCPRNATWDGLSVLY